MILYLDILLFFDFIINLISLLFIQRILNSKINLTRNILASLIGSITIIACLYSNIILFILKIISGLLITLLGLSYKSINKIIIQISLFYTLNFALAGFLTAFRINHWFLLLISIGLILALFTFEGFKKYYINLFNSKYNVIINNYSLDVCIDTAHNATHLGLPVVFINSKYQDKEEDTDIFIKTISGISIIKGVRVKKLEVISKHNKLELDCYVSYVNFEYDCLIGLSSIM